jgi:DNA-directed RNA polymerase subunit RPC12/RpoP
MIHFTCAKCGKSFTATNDYAGKKGQCTKCNSEIFIPASVDAPPPELQKPKFARDVPEIIENNFHEKSTGESQPEKYKRKLPWLIDIFLYPISKSGITTLLVLSCTPLLLMIITYVFSIVPVIGIFIGFSAALLICVINAYAFLYLCECIQNSADGYVRLSINAGDHTDLGETFFMTLRIFVCLLLFLLPGLIRLYYFNEADNILDFIFVFREYNTPDKGFYILSAISAAFFPMGLLSIVMKESFSGLNPILICKSILRTHIFYVWLLILFWAGITAIVYVRIFIIKTFRNEFSHMAAIGVFRFFEIYILMIVAHLMGRFYYKNSHRLDWL